MSLCHILTARDKGSMDRKKLKALIGLVLTRFSVEVTGGSRQRIGQVMGYEYTPEFQEFWVTI